MRNWAGNVRFQTAGLLTPTDVSDVQRAIASAAPGGIRPLGTAHSFSTIADGSPDTALLRAPGGAPTDALAVSADRSSVRVPTGMRYGDLAPLLDADGLALANLASLAHISVGGSIATGTHGSGVGTGSLATAVRALEIVDGRGELVILRRGDPDFPGVVVSLGALGLVTHVELDVEPSFDIAQRVYLGLPLDGVLESFDEVTSLGYSVSLFTTWSDPDVVDQLWLKRRPDRDPAAPDDVLGARPASVTMHPIAGLDASACTPQLDEPGTWFERLPHFRINHTPSNGVEIQSEYLVPRDRALDALREVRALAAQIAPHLLVCEIRRIAADDLWLSGAYATDAVGVHFTWRRRPAQLQKLLPVLEAHLLPLGARPHWGKQFDAGRAQLEPLYPRFDDFHALAERFDPNRVFRNDFLADKLGLRRR